MNALDSPLEALTPFSSLNFDVFTLLFNKIWAWAAVITAAVSLWRIRTAAADGATKASPPEEESVADDQSPPPSATATSWVGPLETTVATTTGKFMVYYENWAQEDAAEHDGVKGFEEVDSGGGRDEWCGAGDWKWTVRTRMEEMGWYRYQDLAVLDGNVVRLWDSCRRKTTAVSDFPGGVAW